MIQKTAETTSHLVGNKVVNEITKVSKNLPQNNLEHLKVKYKYLNKNIYL